MERLCKAIGVQPDDIVMLVLAQKLNAQNMGFFTLDEWTKGMQNLQLSFLRYFEIDGKF